MLLLGWGEGLDQAADFILDRPGGERATVHMSNTYTTLGYLMPPSATVETHAYETDMASIVQWAEADYYIAYVTQWQRGYFSRPIDYLSQLEPVHTVRLGNVEFARIYDLNAIPPPSEMLDGHACSYGYADQLQLVGYDAGEPMDYSQRVNHALTLYFASGSDPKERYQTRVYLSPRSPSDESISHTVSLEPSMQEGMLSQVDIQYELPDGSSIDDYIPIVVVLDDITGEPITPTNAISGEKEPFAIMDNCD